MVSNIVVSRTDRIGDLILSTPVLRCLRFAFPNAKIHLLASDYAADVVEGLDSIDEIHRLDSKNVSISQAREIFRKTNCDLFISLENHPSILFGAWLERVKLRVGPRNHWYTYFTLNKGLRQKRSQVEMHEADYGLELLTQVEYPELDQVIQDPTIRTEIAVHPSPEVDRWLAELDQDRYILIHPGMGGSALNLSEKQYAEIIRALIRRTSTKILMSTGPNESALQARYQRSLGTEGKQVSFWSGTLKELAYLISKVDLVIVPSTGPLHMAVALNKPVVTFFPPIRVQSAKRWGPYRADPKNVLLFDPEKANGATICHQVYECLGEKCAHYRCMDSLDLNWVVGWAKQKLGTDMKAGGIRENHPAS